MTIMKYPEAKIKKSLLVMTLINKIRTVHKKEELEIGLIIKKKVRMGVIP